MVMIPCCITSMILYFLYFPWSINNSEFQIFAETQRAKILLNLFFYKEEVEYLTIFCLLWNDYLFAQTQWANKVVSTGNSDTVLFCTLECFPFIPPNYAYVIVFGGVLLQTARFNFMQAYYAFSFMPHSFILCRKICCYKKLPLLVW